MAKFLMHMVFNAEEFMCTGILTTYQHFWALRAQNSRFTPLSPLPHFTCDWVWVGFNRSMHGRKFQEYNLSKLIYWHTVINAWVANILQNRLMNKRTDEGWLKPVYFIELILSVSAITNIMKSGQNPKWVYLPIK